MFTASKKSSLRFFSFICLIAIILFGNFSNLFAGEPDLYLYSDYSEYPAVDFRFDRAGYSDDWYWGVSDRHLHWQSGSHETLSGEFAAALYFSGIQNNESMWLTDQFYYPKWSTGTAFNQISSNYWDDPNNPIDGMDTAQSIVEIPNQIRVTIDYNLVDLGANGYSPLSFLNADGTPAYVQSERYVLIQTYTIKNVRTDYNTIQDLRFFQFLHAHPLGTRYPAEFSSYSNANYLDALKGYDPQNPNLNFRYDISQWRSGDPETEHVDWIGFSSTVQPNHFDNGTYVGDNSEPTTGTHKRIESKSLNDAPYIDANDAAGAMEWDLGDLAWNTEKKVTVAAMFGCGPVHYSPIILTKTKTDNIETCVEPNGTITYQICYDANGFPDTNVILTDYLSDEVDFNYATGDYIYDSPNKIVYWPIDSFTAESNDCFTLQVKVKSTAPRGQYITNTAQLTGDNYETPATERTKVCCDYSVVYVDKDANSGGNGKSWPTAYKELRDALINVRDGNCGCAENIWVAAGTYAPTEANDTNPSGKTFTMLDGIDIYGHFAGNETSINQRNLADNNNITILTGDIDGNNTSDVFYVVTAADSRLDGFTVRKSKYRGISCGNCSPTIENCVIKNNGDVGIFCASGSNVAVANTFINNNGYSSSSSSGIFCDSSSVHINIDKCTVGPNNVSYGLRISSCAEANATDSIFNGNSGEGIGAFSCSNFTIERCTIQRNSSNGLLIGSNSNVQASLNIISNNNLRGVYIPSDTDNSRLVSNFIYGNKYCGIEVCNNNTAIINNTIVNNNSYGISGYDDSNITSNIIWGNGDGSFDGGSFTKVHYNCIEGNYPGINNINLNPQFRDPCDNDYHLLGTSPCIDTGDPCFSNANEKDIDGQRRILDGDFNGIARVDMGADEFGIVNFLDFAVFAESWKTSQGQTAYNNLCDFHKDNKIDFKDLYIFADNWLSIPDWFVSGGEGAYFADSSIGGEMETMMSEPESMPALSEAEGLMSQASEQLLLMAGEGETAAIYLVSDVNEPNSSAGGWLTPGDEVTVQVYSDVPLFAMGLGITVTGDANITSAMSTADCNQFGWDPSWPTDPLIDPTGWVYISGVKWEADVDGVVGYIKFRYNSGQVSVSITEGDAFDADCGPVLISSGALTFGADPNE